MGNPDGGWYDETPPQVIGAEPEDKGINVNSRKIKIFFNEFIKIENATDNVIVSPPQLEQPEIKAAGKRILIELKDSLKSNTTYTIDFSDAISDNNEGNPLGNFTYSFSTGDRIDTLEVSGNVLEAENLEPVKGILVGLHPVADSLKTGSSVLDVDSVFRKQPLLRVSRTDSRGHFVIKGIAPGSYRVFALQDMDGTYTFSQKSEKIAFNHEIFVPSFKPDVRQDTIWSDSLHIRSITPVHYTHFLPDDIMLRAFTELQTDRFFLKTERKQANRFDVFFSYGHTELPTIKGLNFNAEDAFVIEPSEKKDTILYWLRDTTLVNQDTLSVEMTYYATDSLGELQLKTDTLEILSKDPYAKRMKKLADEHKEWKKKQEKAAKKGMPVDSVMPVKHLDLKWNAPSELAPDQNISVAFMTPLAIADTSKIHLYSKIDTLWYEAPYEFRPMKNAHRTYELLGEWRPEVEYSLEVDSAAFTDIYGLTSNKLKQGFKVKSLDSFSSLIFTFEGMAGKNIIAYLLDKGGNTTKTATTTDGAVQFFYIKPGTYYLQMLVDHNGNGQWDTGNYDEDLQPEEVYYYPHAIECKEKWDVTLSWNPKSTPLLQQKPRVLIKQKDEKKKATIKNRNAERARQKGIEYIQGVTGVKL
ncbi:MAG: Ig-like domain-containing protein [Prevotella sp.]|nr:Ig-like domain-containing protein [Prevotella sp.]